MPGRFITLEGIDGAGKSTHMAFIAAWLSDRSIDVVVTREPGGTSIGESLRHLLLDQTSTILPETETLMMFASRQQLLAEVIRPALDRGCWVVSDRFTDATFAYQGGGRGVSEERLSQLEVWVQQGLQPDLTLLFDVPLAIAQQRLSMARCQDRFEQEAAAFHQRVRQAYLARARQHSRYWVIDATEEVGVVQTEIVTALNRLLASS